MSILTLAVISDIHIGDSARSADLLPPGSKTTRRKENFIEAFERFVVENNISADCLVIAGDLSSKADAGEFVHASTISNRIASALGVNCDQVYFTFGNHDVDWSVLKLAEGGTPETREFRWQQRYAPITNTNNIFKNLTTASTTNNFTGSLFTPPFAGLWRNSPHLFAAINTSTHDCPDEQIHYGFVRDETIEWLIKNIDPRADGDLSVRCLLLHHHLTPHGNLGTEARDHSVCQNADRLLDVVRDLDFDLIIHGHKHLPRFEIQLIKSDHPVAILGAGSFCADLGKEFGGGVQNQFHLLSIRGRFPESSRIFGVLKNWAYVFPNGWTPNVPNYTVVDHLIGFGGPLNWRELASMLHQPIRNRALAGKPFELSTIGPIYEQLDYVSPETARRAVEEIARIENLEIAWLSGPTISAFFQ